MSDKTSGKTWKSDRLRFVSRSRYYGIVNLRRSNEAYVEL